jgi:inorganic pyrophosphatase
MINISLHEQALDRIAEFEGPVGRLLAVIETPKGSRNKYSFDDRLGLFKLKSVLPLGAVFPFDFGFFPRTLGGDGDPLDVLLLMDDHAFAGCVVEVRLIGVIEAEQREKNGKTTRNDRLIGTASQSPTHQDITELRDLSTALISEIEHFFSSYNAIRQREFRILRKAGAGEALTLIRRGRENYNRSDHYKSN